MSWPSGVLPALLAALVAILVTASASRAHEVRPALLQITERADGRYDVLWKQPVQGDLALHLAPHLSGGLLDGSPTTVDRSASFQLSAWRGIYIAGGLDGRTVSIEGLRQTITDVLVSISLANGDQVQQILRPQAPSVVLRTGGSGLAVPAYLVLGIKHILTGADHLCFVLGLLFLVRNRLTLLKTLTAFTLAHSITLAATALHLITVRPPLIEALVALSILFVAVELANFQRGREGLTSRFPWMIAFSFGLLHGVAFAGALAEVGLPPHAIPLSLLLFNLGVELGQILFVALVLCAAWLLARSPLPMPHWSRWIPPYAIGTFASVWLFERLQVAIASATA